MTRLSTLLCTLSFTLIALTTASQASAQAPGIDIGLGVLGYGGGSFLDEPQDKIVLHNNQNFRVGYPGFGGLGGGYGLTLDTRFFDIVGLEIDLFFTEDKGKGDINDITITIGQDAVHLPVLFKLVLPTALIKPNIFIGLEWVFPGTPTVETENAAFTNQLRAEADTYTLLAFGFGVELALPIVGVDLRIPLSIRGGMNLDDTGDIKDRTSYDGSVQTFQSAWQWHVSATLGLVYYFPVHRIPLP